MQGAEEWFMNTYRAVTSADVPAIILHKYATSMHRVHFYDFIVEML